MPNHEEKSEQLKNKMNESANKPFGQPGSKTPGNREQELRDKEREQNARNKSREMGNQPQSQSQAQAQAQNKDNSRHNPNL